MSGYPGFYRYHHIGNSFATGIRFFSETMVFQEGIKYPEFQTIRFQVLFRKKIPMDKKYFSIRLFTHIIQLIFSMPYLHCVGVPTHNYDVNEITKKKIREFVRDHHHFS